MHMAAKPRFQLLLVKPSHYDDDGYVIRWWRAMIPSNSLAAVYGIAADCADRQVLGPDIGIDIEAIDETNTRIDVPALIARLRRNGNFGLLALVGVQSNQYPRALDIAREFRRAGVAVAIGGFHVSGCLSMLDGRAVELDACRDLGISIFAGEAEGRLEAVLQDAAAGRLAPVYNFMNDLPGMEGTVVPFLPKRNVTRTLGLSTSFDAGRGCPYQCSFCTIINVQGRKSRYRSADDVEHLVRHNWAQGAMFESQYLVGAVSPRCAWQWRFRRCRNPSQMMHQQVLHHRGKRSSIALKVSPPNETGSLRNR
jgi:hypothetical protein